MEPKASAQEPTSPGRGNTMMELPLYERFTPEQIMAFGPIKRGPQVLHTERHVYTTPFLYTNVEVGNFYEIDPTKGIELKADDGFITVREEQPIVAVTVVGSGCVPNGYNICEWWDEGEGVETMADQLVKRQRVDNLNGTHPSIWSLLLLGKAPGHTFESVSSGDIADACAALRKLSDEFYGGYPLGLYENCAHFRVGPPQPRKITVRAGCKGTEDPGTAIARYPADYAVRVVETIVITGESQT
jgi:hypothetical protein